MASHNDVTGDAIKSGKGNPKQFKENMGKIKPSCYKDCKYLVDTLTKCRVCDWHPNNLKENNDS